MTTTEVGPGLVSVLAPNPGPMTLDGTNTWIIGGGSATSVVIDPGPEHEGHLGAVLAAAGGRIGTILVTHRHLDHTEGAARLAELADCGVRSVDPAYRIGTAGLADGDEVPAGDFVLQVVETPGHTDDSVSLLLSGVDVPRLLTGDTVLGRGTTVIAAPDGDLAAYLGSLEELLRLVDERGVTQLLPGHGPVVDRPRETITDYLAHRQQRLDQVRAALRGGAVTADEVVAAVYADVDRSLWPAAKQSVEAQLRYLGTSG